MASESLYRAVDEAERLDILARRSFRTVPHSLEVKLFWESRASAEQFIREVRRAEEVDRCIVEVRLDSEVMKAIPVDIMDSKPARIVYLEKLPWFNGCIEDLEIPEMETNA